MATISTSQVTTNLTPPSSSHGQDSWNYSVPVQLEPISPFNPEYHQNHRRQPSEPNDYALSSRAENLHLPRLPDYNHLAPVGTNELNRQNSDISDTPSAPDSLLDLYGNNKSGQSMDSGEMRSRNYDMEDGENSRWIHRDKLARIENEELQAAGIKLPRPRTANKSIRRDHSRGQDYVNGIRSEGQKRQKMSSNSIGEGDGSNVWDLRLPEESVGDLGTKGISKIPISKSSPLPIPIDYLERDTPIPRKTSGNWYDDDPLSFKQARSRSHSIKSSIVLDETTISNLPMPTPVRTSPTPTAVRTSSTIPASTTRTSPTPQITTQTSTRVSASQTSTQTSTTPTTRTSPNQPSSTHVRPSPSEKSPVKKPTVRKGSIGANAIIPGSRQTSAQRQRPRGSTNAPDIRPRTRSGDLINTSKRPEGDPPWLATMYKPDPRLPPDQQVIPTHAKRMQQEQWEKEGKYGNVYDTSFRPLNQQDHQPPPDLSSPPDEPEPKSVEPTSEWPLTRPQSPPAPAPVSPTSPSSPISITTVRSSRLSTSARSQGERIGNYSTMPKIPTGTPQGVNLPDPKPTIHLQDSPDSKNNCGCCVVM